MCTFWLVEALTRAGKYDKSFISQAVLMFEDMVSYSNHLGLYSEEITRSGEVFPTLERNVDTSKSLGNFPQAFTHMACISAAFNLDRVLP